MLTCRVNTAVRASGNTTDTSVRARTGTADPTVKVCVDLLSFLIKASSKFTGTSSYCVAKHTIKDAIIMKTIY